jgi:hypothetical protein
VQETEIVWAYLINGRVGVARAYMKIYTARIKNLVLKMYNEKMKLLLHRRWSSMRKAYTHKKGFYILYFVACNVNYYYINCSVVLVEC